MRADWIWGQVFTFQNVGEYAREPGRRMSQPNGGRFIMKNEDLTPILSFPLDPSLRPR